MSRFFFIAAFILGAAAISFMSFLFIGSDALALTITLVIALVYLVGLVELVQFRAATARFSEALRTIPESLTSLDQWLERLPSSLHNAVRLRIEGDKVGLPAPVLTPYLVGLLVMLGLLGTFAGMVDTLKGAVIALEGSTELEAVRAGLTAPIKGLGLAFGTSVAGIAASAMLGLMSTLARRERMLATRLLDNKTASELRDFSLQYNRQQTFKAMQAQSQALPVVADKLCEMADKLSAASDSLSDKLLTNQNEFHDTVKNLYTDLASSVDKSLHKSLADSGRLAGESIKPALQTLMSDIRTENEKTQQQLTNATQQQLSIMATSLTESSKDISHYCKESLSQQGHNNEQLLERLSTAFTDFNGQYATQTATTLNAIESSQKDILNSSQQNLASQQRANEELITKLSAAFNELKQQQAKMAASSANAFDSKATAFSKQSQHNLTLQSQANEALIAKLTTAFTELNQQQAEIVANSANAFDTKAEEISKQSQQNLSLQAQANEALIAKLSASFGELKKQQAELSTTSLAALESSYSHWAEQQKHSDQQRLDLWIANFDKAADNIHQQQQQISEHFVNSSADVSQLLAASEALVETRIASEAAWLTAHEQRMNEMTTALNSKLEALREQEQLRGHEAVARLASLESSVAEHLAALGSSLEAPMTRLIETASETPRAAAEVIDHLKREISNNIERDNQLLQERGQIIAELNTLTSSLAKTSTGQCQAVEKLVSSSTQMLEDVSEKFSGHIEGGVEKITAISDNFALSATEISSLGEAFNHAVHLFNDANNQLIENLNRIESAMDKSTERSDEQLAYYVAQAREVIDHSIQSQSQLFERLRQLSQQAEISAEAV